MTNRGEKTQKEALAILRQRRGASTAYDVLGKLCKANPKIAPPTAYRELASLVERRKVRRLESLNAFIIWQCDQQNQTSILSIREDCGTVEENAAPSVLNEMSSILEKSGFAPIRQVIEAHGHGVLGKTENYPI